MKNLPKNLMKIIPLTAGLFILALPLKALAAERDFTIIPPKLELTAKPGDVISSSVKLKNNTDQPQEFKIGATDFIVKDSKGSPDFTSLKSNWALTSWLSFSPKSIIIEPGKIGYVSVNISIPEDALPGGRYASIYFSQPGLIEEGQTASGVAAELRNLILLRIQGPIEENAIIRQFKTPKLSEYGPITIETEIANLGNYHISPLGGIKITNMFGKTVFSQELDERNIFPKTSYEYESEFGSKWLFGKFQADLTAAFGEQNQPLTATIYFWVWPWRLTSLALASIFAIVLIIVLIKKLKAKRDDRAIEEDGQEETEE